MPVGAILLTILLVLVSFGLTGGVLREMRLPARQAALAVGAMLLGSAVDVDLGPGLSLNLGAGLLPLAAALSLLWTAGSAAESARGVAAALVTAAAVYLVGRWFPPGEPTELNLFAMDAQYLYALTGGLVGFTAGGNRRTGFAAAILGVLLADLTHYLGYLQDGLRTGLMVHAGGGGAYATTILAGLLAVVVAEFAPGYAEAVAKGEES